MKTLQSLIIVCLLAAGIALAQRSLPEFQVTENLEIPTKQNCSRVRNPSAGSLCYDSNADPDGDGTIDGQLMTYNGSSWVASSVKSDAYQIGGVPLCDGASISPTDNYILKYDAGSSCFALEADTGGGGGDMEKSDYDTDSDNIVERADALANDPTPCSSGQFVRDVAADGQLTCGEPTGTAANPGGDDTEVQINDNDTSFTGDDDFTYNTTTDVLNVPAIDFNAGGGADIQVGTGADLDGDGTNETFYRWYPSAALNSITYPAWPDTTYATGTQSNVACADFDRDNQIDFCFGDYIDIGAGGGVGLTFYPDGDTDEDGTLEGANNDGILAARSGIRWYTPKRDAECSLQSGQQEVTGMSTAYQLPALRLRCTQDIDGDGTLEWSHTTGSEAINYQACDDAGDGGTVGWRFRRCKDADTTNLGSFGYSSELLKISVGGGSHPDGGPYNVFPRYAVHSNESETITSTWTFSGNVNVDDSYLRVGTSNDSEILLTDDIVGTADSSIGVIQPQSCNSYLCDEDYDSSGTDLESSDTDIRFEKNTDAAGGYSYEMCERVASFAGLGYAFVNKAKECLTSWDDTDSDGTIEVADGDFGYKWWDFDGDGSCDVRLDTTGLDIDCDGTYDGGGGGSALYMYEEDRAADLAEIDPDEDSTAEFSLDGSANNMTIDIDSNGTYEILHTASTFSLDVGLYMSTTGGAAHEFVVDDSDVTLSEDFELVFAGDTGIGPIYTSDWEIYNEGGGMNFMPTSGNDQPATVLNIGDSTSITTVTGQFSVNGTGDSVLASNDGIAIEGDDDGDGTGTIDFDYDGTCVGRILADGGYDKDCDGTSDLGGGGSDTRVDVTYDGTEQTNLDKLVFDSDDFDGSYDGTNTLTITTTASGGSGDAATVPGHGTRARTFRFYDDFKEDRQCDVDQCSTFGDVTVDEMNFDWDSDGTSDEGIWDFAREAVGTGSTMDWTFLSTAEGREHWGVLTINTGAADGASMSLYRDYNDDSEYDFDNFKGLELHVTMVAGGTLSDNMEVRVGWTDSYPGHDSRGTDALIFEMDSDADGTAANVFGVCVAAGSATTVDLGVTLEEWHTFSVIVADDLTATWYVDGVANGTTCTAPNEATGEAAIKVHSNEAEAKVLHIDYYEEAYTR